MASRQRYYLSIDDLSRARGAISELSFRYRNHMVFQVQLSKRIDAVPVTRDYMADEDTPSRKGRAAA